MITHGLKPIYGVATPLTGNSAVDFIGIPAWAKKITVLFIGVSTNGTSLPVLRIGNGEIGDTGYAGSAAHFGNAAAVVCTIWTSGFGISAAWGADSIIHGTITLSRRDPTDHIWVASGNVAFSNWTQIALTGGSKELSSALDRIRLTTVNGTDTFDAGSANIHYE